MSTLSQQPFHVVGRGVARRDGMGHVTGTTEYVDDVRYPGMLHLKMVRNPLVHARINGIDRKLLVDSGATITALSVDTAEAAGLTPERSPFPIILKTANGAVAARTARVATLRIGNVVARNLPVVVSPSFGDTEVIGMNFLSKLKSWRVEDNVLILEPHHPQTAAQPDAA